MLSYEEIRFGSACDNRCTECPVTDDQSMRSLNELVGQAEALSEGENVILTGGEPTLHEDLFALISYVRRRGAERVKLRTNGRSLADGRFTADLVREGCRFFEVSLFGARPESHDAVTGVPGSFHETLRGFETLCGFSSGDGPGRELFVTARIGVTRQNVEDLFAAVSLLVSFGVDVLHFVRMGSRLGILQGAQTVANAMKVAGLNRCWSVCEGFPPCTMTGSETHLIELIQPRAATGKKPRPCAKCVFTGVCAGPPKDVAERERGGVFRPVSRFSHMRGLEYLMEVMSTRAA